MIGDVLDVLVALLDMRAAWRLLFGAAVGAACAALAVCMFGSDAPAVAGAVVAVLAGIAAGFAWQRAADRECRGG